MTQELLYLGDTGRTPGMYPNAQAPRLPAQTQYIPPPYDFTGYHQLGGVGDPSTSSWNPVYAPREDYLYSFLGSSPNAGQVSYTSPDIGAPPTAAGGSSFTPYNVFSSHDNLCAKGRPHEAIRAPVSGGKTRTKDKYRVVYTDHQRQELENEFQYNRYITMRRKTELSMALSLSERQVKIWFQNRRAKERKMNRKRQQHSQQPSTSTPTPPALEGSTDPNNTTSPAINLLSDAISDEY